MESVPRAMRASQTMESLAAMVAATAPKDVSIKTVTNLYKIEMFYENGKGTKSDLKWVRVKSEAVMKHVQTVKACQKSGLCYV